MISRPTDHQWSLLTFRSYGVAKWKGLGYFRGYTVHHGADEISLFKDIPLNTANSNQRLTRRAFTRYVTSKKRMRSGGYLALSRLCLRVWGKTHKR